MPGLKDALGQKAARNRFIASISSWVKAHGLSFTREHDEIGLLTTCGPAFRLSRTPVQAGHPAPKPGRHAREILEEHGLGGDYQRLVDAGVVVVDGIKAG